MSIRLCNGVKDLIGETFRFTNGTETTTIVPRFEPPFDITTTNPGTGNAPGDTRLHNDFHQTSTTSTTTASMLSHPSIKVSGGAQVVTGMIIGLIEVNKVDQLLRWCVVASLHLKNMND